MKTKATTNVMSNTRSISLAQTDDRVLKAGFPRDKQSDRYTSKGREQYVDHSYDYAPLFKRTYEASEVHQEKTVICLLLVL